MVGIFTREYRAKKKKPATLLWSFFLNPEPILERFPHADSYLRATGTSVSNEKELETAIKNFKENRDEVKPLNWKAGDFKGQCFDTRTYNDLDGGERNIACFVYITGREAFIYQFELQGSDEYIEKVDPGLAHLEHFINSLKKVNF